MKTKIDKWLLLLIMVAISACKVSKDVSVPQENLPDTFRNAERTADTASFADISWKAVFTDQTLVLLIDKAIAKNHDMQLALKNIDAAQLMVKQVKWNHVPSVGVNVSGSTANPSDNSLNGLTLGQFLGTNHIEDYSANLTLSWEADIWGRIRSQSKAALAQYLQTQEARKAIQTNLVASIAQGYYRLLMFDEQLRIAKRNLDLNDSTLRIVRLQYDAGLVTLAALQQSQAQRMEVAQLLPQLEQHIILQENALQLLTGELPAQLNRKGLLDDITFPDTLTAGVPMRLLSRRPDIKSQELELTVANAKVGISKAAMYPTLRITASGGLNSLEASDWFKTPSSLFGVVAGSVFQPILQQKQMRTQYKLTLVEREKSVIKFRQSVLIAVGEVSDALAKIEKLKQTQSIAVDRVDALQQATFNANLLFKNGKANYLEVIVAQGNVLKGELELAEIKTSMLSAVSELYRSLGGGWN
jgi:NodT family efflux transporter outer membrane factor (OMF) lipoprotein